MPRGVIKLNDESRDWYLEWSTIVDAPTTGGMTREDMIEYLLTAHDYSREDLVQRLNRLDAKGTTFMMDKSVDDTIEYNRAGLEETCLTKDEIIASYCWEQKKLLGHRHKSEDEGCPPAKEDL